MPDEAAFTFNGGRVEPGEAKNFRYTVTETYLVDPVRIPVTVINGEREGPTMFLSAASHGDELNGVEAVREVAQEWNHEGLCGTLVCLPVLNVPGFLAQQRYLPIYDRDLNRSFPGDPEGTNAKRIAHSIFSNFIEPCDLGIDFHTSTRGRTNMLHVRGDMSNEEVSRLAKSFGSHLIIDSTGPEGTLRHEATDIDIPTITIELGEAMRFQRSLIDGALAGVESVFAEFGLSDTEVVRLPSWRTIIAGGEDKTWVRSPVGGIVEIHAEGGEYVTAGEPIATITDPFKAEPETVEAPFDGVLVGHLKNPVVYPGNPICHLVAVDASLARYITDD